MAERAREIRPGELAAVGRALQRRLPSILEAFAERLRKEPAVPRAGNAPEPDLLDHTSTFLADLSHSLLMLENSGREEPGRRLRDGTEIQRLVAELHGRQRARLGWSTQALAREWQILREEIAGALREELPRGQDVESALALLNRLMDRADEASRRSLRHARAAAS